MLHERYVTPLLAYSRDPRVGTAVDVLIKAAAVIAFLFMVSGYFALLTLPIYGHDEVHYHLQSYYRFALVDDGRWLNYSMHDFLRSLPLWLWSLLYLALWWTLIYRLARGCTFDAPLAALVASVALVASPFHEISLWPASVVPALALAWLAVWMQARGRAYQVIYVVSGILMFGSIQTMYFVLPLLFLPHFLDTSQPARARWLLLLRHMLWWVAGSVAGLLFMCLMLWMLAGIWFPQPAPWRAAQPVVDGSSLVDNVRYVGTSFALWLEALLRNGGVTYGFIFTVVAVAMLRARSLLAQAPALALLGAVLISFFVFCIPFAPVIHMRSLIAMALVVVFALALVPGPTMAGRILAAVLLLKVGYYYSVRSHDLLEVQRSETAVFLRELEDLFPGYPMNYAALALYGTMDPSQPEARRFNDSGLMHPLLVALGVTEILDCRIPTRCDTVGPGGEAISVMPFAGGQLELSVDAANVGIIRYSDGTAAAPAGN